MKAAILHAKVAQDASLDDLDTLDQAEEVGRALRGLGHETVNIEFPLDLKSVSATLGRLAPDVVFNLVESVDGAGRLIHFAPSLLDHLSIPYTGCPAEAVFITSGKTLAKKTLSLAGLPTPPWMSSDDSADGRDFSPGRFIVKSAWEHASVGLDEDSVIHAQAACDLLDVLRERESRDGGEWYAERFVEGREFNVPLLAGAEGPRILPASEIVFDAYPAGKVRVVGYRAKWQADSFEYNNTPRRLDFLERDRAVVKEMELLALKCWSVFGLAGYARVDFRVDENGKPWILEINANPCITPGAGFEASARHAGLSYADIVEALVDDALTRHGRRSRATASQVTTPP
jgi:D-alanine-D-alanine ligase